MLLRDLKKIANKCCINPRKPTSTQRVVMGVGNPQYWTVKAVELLTEAQFYTLTSKKYIELLEEATELLILTQAHIDEKAQIAKKARDDTAKQNKKNVDG